MSNAPVVAIGADFFSAYADIPRKKQGKVREFIDKFRVNPTASGINYEKIRDGGVGFFSVRIDKAYRGIVHKPDSGNTYILLWVDHHDDAYDWARRHKVSVHPETGSLQVIDASVVSSVPETSPARADEEIPPLLRKLKDRHLASFGVPEEVIPVLRAVTTEDELDAMARVLPEEAYDCLLLFVSGCTVQEIMAEISPDEPETVDTEDIEKALQHSDSKRRFWVVEDEIELAAMLAAPLEKWRVFLHPSQRRLVERDWNGPVRVLGGAGTGKTVAAIHRTKWLAENRFTGDSDRILFTTFTKNLAEDIRTALESITTPEVMKRIEITNLDEWVYKFLKRNDYGFAPAYGHITDPFWEKALSVAPSGFDDSFFREEWGKVILDQGIDTLEEYLHCSRSGRGTPLSRAQRKSIWPVFQEFRSILAEHSYKAPLDAMRDAANLIREKKGLLPYKAVIVDEAQDLGPREFCLINALVMDTEPENSLFIAGDAHQRIYGKKVVLRRVGINIMGRSRKLRINYRTTEENRNWAVALLSGVPFDDLNGGWDDQSGYKSLMHGAVPEVHRFDSFQEEITFIIEKLTPLLPEVGKLDRVCIALRTNKLVQQYAEELDRHGLKPCVIKPSEKHDPDKHGVRIATMHRVKGLEFDTMIIASANEGIIPHHKAVSGSDSITEEEGLVSEKALLYVAVTRARKSVLITGYGQISTFLRSDLSGDLYV